MRKPQASARDRRARGGPPSAATPKAVPKGRIKARPAKAAPRGRDGVGTPAAKPGSRPVRPAEQRRLERVPREAAPPNLAASRGKYVYCIIEATDALTFGTIGIG